MEMEYKNAAVSGVEVLDENEGLVKAIVSVTGIEDGVHDVIEPGAYAKTLQTRTPKGVWHHSWEQSVSRTESIKEMLPGDAGLPKTLPNGSPWPKQAGALQVITKFNLKTQRGNDAYQDVIFFGPQQEWSIGYSVPADGATVKNGVRHIKALELFEYSPVLFGAMPAARTVEGVKQAQLAFKSAMGVDLEAFMVEIKSLESASIHLPDSDEKDAKPKPKDDGDPDAMDDDEDGEVFEDDGDSEEKKEINPDEYEMQDGVLSASQLVLAQKAADALTELIAACAPQVKAIPGANPNGNPQSLATNIQSNGDSATSLVASVEEYANELGSQLSSSLQTPASNFDSALNDGDDEALEEAADNFLDIIETAIDTADGAGIDALKALAQGVSDLLKEHDGGEDEADSMEGPGDESAEGESKSIGLWDLERKDWAAWDAEHGGGGTHKRIHDFVKGDRTYLKDGEHRVQSVRRTHPVSGKGTTTLNLVNNTTGREVQITHQHDHQLPHKGPDGREIGAVSNVPVGKKKESWGDRSTSVERGKHVADENSHYHMATGNNAYTAHAQGDKHGPDEGSYAVYHNGERGAFRHVGDIQKNASGKYDAIHKDGTTTHHAGADSAINALHKTSGLGVKKPGIGESAPGTTKAQRTADLLNARAAAARGDHKKAAELFKKHGISYLPPKSGTKSYSLTDEDGDEIYVKDINENASLEEDDMAGWEFKDYGGDYQIKKAFNTAKRQELAKTGAAMPDGNFPIEDTEDLDNAISDVGRAKDPAAAKAHIKKRANALNATHKIPDDWKDGEPDSLEAKDGNVVLDLKSFDLDSLNELASLD